LTTGKESNSPYNFRSGLSVAPDSVRQEVLRILACPDALRAADAPFGLNPIACGRYFAVVHGPASEDAAIWLLAPEQLNRLGPMPVKGICIINGEGHFKANSIR
jgi:hypothetical protein